MISTEIDINEIENLDLNTEKKDLKKKLSILHMFLPENDPYRLFVAKALVGINQIEDRKEAVNA